MKKIVSVLACAILFTYSAIVFSSVSLSAHPHKLATTGDIRGKIRQVSFSDHENNPWVRLIIGEKEQQYVVEFKGNDMAVGNTLLDSQGKYIDALYSYVNGIYVVNFLK